MLKISFDTRKFNRELNDFVKHEQEALDLTTKEAADAIVADTNTLDSDIPVIAGSTSVTKVENGYVINKGGSLPHDELAVYSEVGTGDFAKVLLSKYPQEWKDMVWPYYVNGLGRLPASPALYPAFNKNTTNIADKAAQNIGS